MLQNIRDNAKGPILTFIVVAVCHMFAATGVDSILGSRNAGNVASINGESISDQDLREAIYLEKRKILAQMGENIDPSQLEDSKLSDQAMQELIRKKLLLEIAEENKMAISDTSLKNMIRDNPNFQENGKFSKETYQSVIAQSGLTPSLFKRLFSAEVLLAQISSGIIESSFIISKQATINSRFTQQTRDIRYIELSLENEKALQSTSDNEARNYYDGHKDAFYSDESVVVQYIELNQANIKPEVTDEEVETAYQQELANFKSGEQREISHILIKVNEKSSRQESLNRLQEIKNRIAQGDEFADIAREYSEDLGSKDAGGMLGLLDEATAPAEFISALKNMKEGDVSDVIEMSDGLHLIKLDKTSIATAPSFDERKNALTVDLQTSKALPLYLSALEKLKDMAFNSADLSDPASAVDANIQESGIITRDGGSGIFKNKKVLGEIFKDNVLKSGENSDVIELSPTHAVVVRVKQYNPSVLMSFDDVIEKARSLANAEKADKILAEKAKSVRSDIIAGKPMDEIANSNQYTWQVSLGSKRTNPELNQDIVQAAFALPAAKGNQMAIDIIRKTNGDYVVLTASNVKDGDMNEYNPMEIPTFRNYLVRAAAYQEFDAFESGLKSRASIDIY